MPEKIFIFQAVGSEEMDIYRIVRRGNEASA